MKLKIAIALALIGLLLAFALLYKPVQHKEPKCIDGPWNSEVCENET